MKDWNWCWCWSKTDRLLFIEYVLICHLFTWGGFCQMALSVRRCHDNKSINRWLIILIFPIIWYIYWVILWIKFERSNDIVILGSTFTNYIFCFFYRVIIHIKSDLKQYNKQIRIKQQTLTSGKQNQNQISNLNR